MARKNLSPTKKELTQYKALNDLGLTPNAIAVRSNRDPKTVRKYCNQRFTTIQILCEIGLGDPSDFSSNR